MKRAESLSTSAAVNGDAATKVRDDAKALLAKIQSASPSGSKPGSDVTARRQAVQLLANARRQMRDGNYEEAEDQAHQAESLKLTYSRWDDSPAKVLKDVADARASRAQKAQNG